MQVFNFSQKIVSDALVMDATPLSSTIRNNSLKDGIKFL